ILYRGGKVIASLPQEELIEKLIGELKVIAAEDARLIAAGEPLPTGLGESATDGGSPVKPLPIAAG
ncbi:MAG TPA: hypothetical protein VH498_03550, partial [Candidatus Dormibacteraeota bacterium]|nr:hypothetical protein [Candidatus Dormibacteraeota bacterium]